MYFALLMLHLLVCIALVGVVLVQSGKGGGLAGGAFGGSAQTVFGGRGATDFITRATMILGVTFFITSLTLALMSTNLGRSSRSLIQGQARQSSGAGTQAPQTLPPSGSQQAPQGQGAPAPATGSQPAAPQGAPAPAPGSTPPAGGGQ